jgi:two-component system chemotaxis response regulator CheV
MELSSNLANSKNSISLMVFKMVSEAHPKFKENVYYAINNHKVQEVLGANNYELVTTIPIMHNGVNMSKGIIKVREEYIPIYDLTSWLGLEHFDSQRSVFIVAEVNGKKFGFHVAYIYDVKEKDWSEMSRSEGMSKIVSETEIEGQKCYIVGIEEMLLDVLGNATNFNDLELPTIETKKRILIADDSKPVREFMARLMGSLNLRYKIFEDGGQLLSYMEDCDPSEVSMVLTDVEMPIANGHAVIKTLRGMDAYKNLPIVVQSSMTNEDAVRKSTELGATDFAEKLSAEDIAIAIKKYGL